MAQQKYYQYLENQSDLKISYQSLMYFDTQIQVLSNSDESLIESLESIKKLLISTGISHEESMKNFIRELENMNSLLKKKNQYFYAELSQEVNDAVWILRCFYQKNPDYIFKLFDNPKTSEKKITKFMELAHKYSQMDFQNMNIIEISETLLQDSKFYPYYSIYYDKNPGSKEGPWITQIILSREDCNLLVRISYDEVKIGLYRNYPFEYQGDKLEYNKQRHNELYKYADGFLIPSSGNHDHWQAGYKNEEMAKKAHFKIKPLTEPVENYRIKHINQFGIFNAAEAQKIKNRYRENHTLWLETR